MSRTVRCVKLGVEAEGLETPPFPGVLGQRVFDNISAQAWQEWLKLQTMLINEHRLTPFEAKAKQFLAEEREKFLFGSGAAAPEGYVPPKA
ncbi:putative Fe(2+)-trafficking protein [Anaerolineae bacterium]|nr:putative Fe(2+)-trafficking protein [Anaerolineae bacterium]